MTYNVGDRIDLTYLNPPNKNETDNAGPVHRAMSLPSKLIPGSKVRFMAMTQGLIVMSVIEPPFFPTVAVG